MCCGHTGHHGKSHGHGCSCGMHFGPMFWSEKKRINMVEHRIECLQGQVKGLEDLLAELNEEK